jgi:putative colanic acid biosynthesis UDP-glucose lipid carrier transferase
MSANIGQGIFNQYLWLISWIQRILDCLLVLFVMFFSCWWRGVLFDSRYQVLAAITFPLTMMVFQAATLYVPWRGRSLARLASRVSLAWVIVVTVLSVVAFVSKQSIEYSRGALLLWVVATPVALVLLRLFVYSFLHFVRSKGFNTRTAVIAGAGVLGQGLAENIIDTPWLGMRLQGFFDDFKTCGKILVGPERKEVPVLADLDAMVEFVKRNKVDMVYLALPLRAENRLRQIIGALQDTTASVYFVPDVFGFALLRAGLAELRGIPLISLWETPLYGFNMFLKRCLDISLASLFILGSLPLMVLIAIGIKLESPGQVIFKQRRYGLDGAEILIYKFRTMAVHEDGPEISQATRNDSRVTRFGAYLRKTSLDELPQFINVLMGTMSIVGPRPHAVAHNEFYRRHIPGYMLRHKILPGLTGWAQINGWRGETDILEKMQKRIEYDLFYLCNWSIWLDFKIIFLTPFRIYKDPYAY